MIDDSPVYIFCAVVFPKGLTEHAAPPPPNPPVVCGHDQVYSSSTLLDGEAVIVFFRALCAVSREELDASSNGASSAPPVTAISNSGPLSPSHQADASGAAAAASGGKSGGGNQRGGARLYSLQRLLDCAAINSDRIRLIRSKLWNMTGSHLVMVACHTSPSVAIYAVNALYGLAQVRIPFGKGSTHHTHLECSLPIYLLHYPPTPTRIHIPYV